VPRFLTGIPHLDQTNHPPHLCTSHQLTWWWWWWWWFLASPYLCFWINCKHKITTHTQLLSTLIGLKKKLLLAFHDILETFSCKYLKHFQCCLDLLF
jgi:hypothetical protein